MEPKTFAFVSLGCPKNLVDTETMLGILDKDQHEIVASEEAEGWPDDDTEYASHRAMKAMRAEPDARG